MKTIVLLPRHDIGTTPRCTRCSETMGAATGLTTLRKPFAGCLAICVFCGNLMMYWDAPGGLSLRELTAEELEKLQKHPYWPTVVYSIRATGGTPPAMIGGD